VQWSVPELADVITRGLRRCAQADDAAQNVYGFDCFDELRLHPLIVESLLADGYGVWREQRYPGHWHKKAKSHGLRCDLVITPDGLPLRDPEIIDTIFNTQPATDAEAAYWLEVKTVAQFESEGPFRRYSAELLSTVTKDVKKVWGDGVIKHGGLLLVLFTHTKEVADHDLAAWHKRCIDKGYPVGPPSVRGFPLTDRVGNAWCAVALFGVRGV
jgi:hypothetical protein